jgi:hypothetical protein
VDLHERGTSLPGFLHLRLSPVPRVQRPTYAHNETFSFRPDAEIGPIQLYGFSARFTAHLRFRLRKAVSGLSALKTLLDRCARCQRTTVADDGIRELHTRMPVLLAPDGFEPWLAGGDPAVDPRLDAAVTITPVSPKMNEET